MLVRSLRFFVLLCSFLWVLFFPWSYDEISGRLFKCYGQLEKRNNLADYE